MMNLVLFTWNIGIVILAFYVTNADEKLVEDFRNAVPWLANLLAGTVQICWDALLWL